MSKLTASERADRLGRAFDRAAADYASWDAHRADLFSRFHPQPHTAARVYRAWLRAEYRCINLLDAAEVTR